MIKVITVPSSIKSGEDFIKEQEKVSKNTQGLKAVVTSGTSR